MRVVAGLLLGLLAAYALMGALLLFTHLVANQTERWLQQSPPRTLTLADRLLVRTANLVGSHFGSLVFVLLVALPVVGWRVAVRSRR